MREWSGSKKLIDAALHWARGGKPDNEELLEDLDMFGAPPEVVEAWTASNKPEIFEVFPENKLAVEAFLCVQTQMRREGFRYEGVEAGLRMAGIDLDPDLFDSLRLMEVSIVNHQTQAEEREHGRRESHSTGNA